GAVMDVDIVDFFARSRGIRVKRERVPGRVLQIDVADGHAVTIGAGIQEGISLVLTSVHVYHLQIRACAVPVWIGRQGAAHSLGPRALDRAGACTAAARAASTYGEVLNDDTLEGRRGVRVDANDWV